MMRSGTYRALVAVWLLAAGAAHAQTASPAPAVEALAIEITEMQMGQIDLDQIVVISLQQVAEARRITDPKALADLRSLGPILKDEFSSMMPAMTKMASAFFIDNFTLEELRDLRAFYASPTGRKMTAKGQEFGARIGVAMQLAIQQRGPAIDKRIRDEMAKRGHQL